MGEKNTFTTDIEVYDFFDNRYLKNHKPQADKSWKYRDFTLKIKTVDGFIVGYICDPKKIGYDINLFMDLLQYQATQILLITTQFLFKVDEDRLLDRKYPIDSIDYFEFTFENYTSYKYNSEFLEKVIDNFYDEKNRDI